jgi:plastocyanin
VGYNGKRSPAAAILAVLGAVAVLSLLLFGVMMTYAMLADDDMMGGMWDMMDGDMHGMMGGGGPETTGSASGEGEVQIVDYSFQPTVITVTPGTTITWTNEDSAPHNAVGDDFDTGKLDNGDSQSITFDDLGDYAYICTFHPSMEGRVVVRSD